MSEPDPIRPEELLGTWTLVSHHQTNMATGITTDMNAGQPAKGYITYTADGRMFGILIRGHRPKRAPGEPLTDQDCIDLFRTTTAYSGTYSFDGQSVSHHIDISWNEVWTGTTQIRDVRRDGTRLIYTTKPTIYPGQDYVSVATLVWERDRPAE